MGLRVYRSKDVWVAGFMGFRVMGEGLAHPIHSPSKPENASATCSPDHGRNVGRGGAQRVMNWRHDRGISGSVQEKVGRGENLASAREASRGRESQLGGGENLC